MQTESINSLIRFLKTSGIFLIGNVLSKMVSFFMLPLYTAYISPVGYGQYDMAVTYVSLIAGFLFFEVWSGIMRFMYDEKKANGKQTVIKAGLVIFGYSTLLFCLIGVLLAILTDIPYLPLIILYGLGISLTNLYGFSARGLSKNKEYALSGVLGTFAVVLTNILLLTVWHFDYSSLFIAQIAGALAQIIYLEFHTNLLSNFFSVPSDRRLTLSLFRYSLPLCVSVTAYWLLTGFNRIVINSLMGTEANGLYAVGSKFGVIISFVTGCFIYAWQDISFSHAAEHGNDGSFFSMATRAYIKLLGAGAAVAIPACYVIFPIMVDVRYFSAKDTIPLFLLVGLASAVSSFVGNIFHAVKKTHVIFVSMIGSCVLNVVLCFPLIRWFGLNGANLSTFISFLFNILLRCLVLRKSTGFHLDNWNLVIISVWVTLSIAAYCWGNLPINIAWFAVSAAFALYWFRDMLKTLIIVLRGNA